jgi:hypothetical protein
MFSDTAETLKSQYTDKYVKVDASRPELARFRDVVGQVKTVNMNGRALVEFLDYHLNIGWFDIDVNSLTLVEAPSKDVTAKPEPKRAHDKPEGKAAPTSGAKQVADAKAAPAGGEKKLSPLEMARLQGAGGKGAAASPAKPAGEKAAPGKKSTADILAAARGGAGSAPTAAAAKAEAKSPTSPAAPAAKPAGGKLSTADILAAARGKASAPAAAAAAPPAPAEPAASEAAPEAPAPAAAPAAATSGVVKSVDKSGMSVDEMIAYCRSHDAT